MKIDLDDLERKAVAASHREQESGAPPVFLSLIAYIRELEAVADEALTDWTSLDPHGLDAERIGQLRAILEKGAVLP